MSDSAEEYIAKAEKLLRWISAHKDEMIEHGKRGRVDDLERCFCSILVLLCSTHESIASATKISGFDSWRKYVNNLRAEDPLLFYLWKARDSDAHSAVTKWTPHVRELQLKVVDSTKTNLVAFSQAPHSDPLSFQEKIFLFLFDENTIKGLVKKLGEGYVPSEAKQQEAGVILEYSIHALELLPFKCRIDGKSRIVPIPTSHFGKPYNYHSVNAVIDDAIKYYQECLVDLKVLIQSSAQAPSAAKQPIQSN